MTTEMRRPDDHDGLLPERGRAELGNEQELLSSALDAADIIAWQWDPLTDKTTLSGNAGQVMGLPGTTLHTREEFFALIHPDDRERVRQAVQRTLASRDTRYSEEFRLVRPDGQTIWVADKGRVIQRSADRPGCMSGVLMDITDRKRGEAALTEAAERAEEQIKSLDAALRHSAEELQATERRRTEEALEQSEERFRTSVESLLDAFAIYSAIRDQDGRIVDFRIEYVNEAACKANLRTRAQQVGHTLLEIFPQHVASGLFGSYCRVAETGEPLALDAFPFEADWGGYRHLRWFDVRASKLGDGFASAWRDVSWRKQIEQALRASEAEAQRALERVHSVLSSITEAYFVLDDRFRFVEVNPAARRMMFRNMPASALLGRVFWDVFPESKSTEFFRYHHAMEEQCEVHFEGKSVIVGRWFETHVYPRNEQLEVYARDITDRKRAEEALAASEREFRAMFELASAGTAQVDPVTERFIRVNQRLCDITGYSAAELMAGMVLDITHPDDRARDMERVRRALETGTDEWVSEKRYIRKDGQVVWVVVTGRIIRDPHGKPLRSVATILDITARKHAEEALRESEARLKLALEAGRMGFCDWNIATGTGVWSESLWRLFGLEPADQPVSYKHWRSRVHPDDLEVATSQVTQAIQGGAASFTHEFRAVRPDGRSMWLAAQAKILRDEHGKAVRIIGVLFDITVRKQAEEALRESEERLRLALDAGRMGTWEWNLTSNTVHWDAARYALLGRAPASLPGVDAETLLSEVHPQDVPELRRRIAEAMHTGTVEAEFRMLRSHAADDEVQWLAAKGGLVRDAQSGQQKLIGVNFDITARKRAEQALRESEARFRRLSDAVRVLMWVTSPDGQVQYLNRGWREYTGSDPETCLGMNWLEKIHPEDRAMISVARDRAIAAGQEYKFETRIRRHDGAFRWHLARVVPVKGAAGRIEMWVGTATDVQDIKAAEQSARESEARYRRTFECNMVPMGVWTRGGRITEANDSLLDLLGYTQNELEAGQIRWTDLTPPEFSALAQRAVAEIQETGACTPFEKELFRKDGSRVPVYVGGAAFTDTAENGVFFAIDLTEIRAAARAVRESEARFAAFMENSPACAWMKDEEGVYVYINRAVREEFAWLEQDMLGKTDLDVFPASTAMQLRDHDAAVRRNGNVEKFVEIMPGPAGDRFMLSFKFPLHSDMQHQFVGGMALDITEQKRAEEALRDADRRKDEFLATLAHELRNPLAPIRNAIQIMRLLGPADPMLQWTRDVIDRQAQQLTRLVDDLLDVSRITRGKIELRKERVELTVILDRAVETSRPFIEASGHELTVRVPGEPMFVEADVTRVAQIVANLLNNAAKYTKGKGHIWLTAERSNGEAIIRVRDTGIGIAPHMLPRIFEMFTQADTSLDRAQGGLGIGLTIVKSLVELHGGTIEAHSEGLGQGSEFTVRLPAMPEGHAQEEGADEKAGGPSLRHVYRILVVDDNEDAADSLGMLLEAFGYDVRITHDGETALKLGAAQPPNVIFLDLGMPGMSGYEVARRVREMPELRHAYLVALTGWGQEEDRRRTREAGFDHHLVKPVDPTALHELLAVLEAENRG